MANVGDVVTVVTMLGEVIGKLKEETEQGYVLESPRLFVPGEGGTGGFSPGLCMTGKTNLNETHLNKAVVLTVVPSHETIEKGWREAVSGIVVP